MRPDTWEPHWPSDDELLGRGVVHCIGDAPPHQRWHWVKITFSCGRTLAQALVDRYVDDQGNLKL